MEEIGVIDHEFDKKEFGDYDALTQGTTLHTDISKLVGKKYLQKATDQEALEVPNKIHGFLYGYEKRPMFPCVVTIKRKAHWVFFLVDTESPHTFMSSEVSFHPYE